MTLNEGQGQKWLLVTMV